jgi:hypothetical protein
MRFEREGPIGGGFKTHRRDISMIACTYQEGRVTVRGTVREWHLFFERLDPNVLEKGDEESKAREILIVASTVPMNGAIKHSS